VSVESIYEEEILALIASAWDVMTPDQKLCWERIKIVPEKWTEEHYGENAGENWDKSSSGNGGFDSEDDYEGSFESGLDGSPDDDYQDEIFDEGVEDDEGSRGAGFWVVGVLEKTVLWYNDIEEGFNLSSFKSWGKISEYRTKKDDLEVALKQLMAK